MLEDSNQATAEGVAPEREDKETRRLIRKIDLRLTLVLSLIYAFALVDRVNLPSVGFYSFYNMPRTGN